MMQITGTFVIVAPCCGRLYSTMAYTMDAFCVHGVWSDGRKTGIGRPPDDDLRRCRCGDLVFLSECKRLRFVPLPCAEQDTDFGETLQERGPWRYFRGLLRGRPRATPHASDVLPGATPPDLPSLAYVYDSEVTGTTQRYSGRREVENALRRRLWRHCNDRYRGPAGWLDLPDTQCIVPPYEPRPFEVSNMERLLELLVAQPKTIDDWLDIAELHRALGRFEDCQVTLHTVRGTADVRWRAIARGAECAVREPVRCV